MTKWIGFPFESTNHDAQNRKIWFVTGSVHCLGKYLVKKNKYTCLMHVYSKHWIEVHHSIQYM